MSEVRTGTIETRIPGRLDRLPWSRWHWLVVIGLGTSASRPPAGPSRTWAKPLTAREEETETIA